MTQDFLRATPFHARAGEANRLNRWENRNGFTLSSSYGDPHGEALAVRFGAVLADISWHWRVMLAGARVLEFVSRLVTRDVSRLEPGAAAPALWLNDGGAVRGAGTVVRFGVETFLLTSETADADWIARAAALYGVAVHDLASEQGVLAVAGVTAAKVLAAAGLDADVAPLALRKFFWRGLDLAVSRLGAGYEVWCEPDDALIVWDRLVAAGAPFALSPAGQNALDVLSLESGVVRPGFDFAPARDGFASEPSPHSLGLAPLIDAEHVCNGRTAAAGPQKILAGILLPSETPLPQAALARAGRAAGRTLGSLYSPALRRAIALAAVDAEAAAPGTELTAGGQVCRVAALPFLPPPAPMRPPTETPPGSV
ncbi:MAG: aminomethyltransferase family protein [Alphaproteobacteria bacterium]|nr:aminomethyltransferase family protein [Alphaproteobacteria bacterium]MDE2495725.1 aminomethyltransferase family protein [Alphaproteobacteria bacterium]